MLGSLQGLSVIERMEKQAEFAFAGAKKSVHSLVCFVRMEEECLVLFCHFFKQFSIFMCWLTFCHCWAIQMGWGISAKVLLETIQERTTFLFLFQPIGSKTNYDLTCARLPGFSRVLIGWLHQGCFGFLCSTQPSEEFLGLRKAYLRLKCRDTRTKNGKVFWGGLGFHCTPALTWDLRL